MTDTAPENVSVEAFQRVREQNATLQAQVDQLTRTVKDLGIYDKARRHFTQKGVDDPDWAAEVALPSIPKSTEDEIANIGSYLDDKFARLYPTGKPAPDAVEDDDKVPAPDAIQPPGFARPSPAADGGPVELKKFTYGDPELMALIEADDREAIKRLDKEGRINWRTAAPVTPG